MARTDAMTCGIPDPVAENLRVLGSNLRTARKQRGVTMDQMAARMMVTAPTLRKLERGDPTVSLGNLALALWALDISAQQVFPARTGTMPPPEAGWPEIEPLPEAMADDNF